MCEAPASSALRFQDVWGISSQDSQLKWSVARWWNHVLIFTPFAPSTYLPKATQTFQLYIRFSNWLEIKAPQGSLKGFLCGRIEVLQEFDPFFFSDWQESASVCRHTRLEWWRSTACFVRRSTRSSGWCYLSLNIVFSALFYFSVNLPIRWRCGPEAELSDAESSTVIFLICVPVW